MRTTTTHATTVLLLTLLPATIALPFTLPQLSLSLPHMPVSLIHPRTIQPRRSKDCTTAAPGCTCAEITLAQPNWTVTDLAFLVPAAPTGPSSLAPDAVAREADISFNVTNLAAGYLVSCAATKADRLLLRRAGGIGSPEGSVFRCDDAAAPSNRPGAATFSFDRATRVLAINQTWTCGGSDQEGMAAEFFAHGKARIPEGCDADAWTDSSLGAKRNECEHGSFMVPWENIQGMA